VNGQVSGRDRVVAQIQEAEKAEPKGGHHEDDPVGCVLLHDLCLVEHCRRVVSKASAVRVQKHRAKAFGMLKNNSRTVFPHILEPPIDLNPTQLSKRADPILFALSFQCLF